MIVIRKLHAQIFGEVSSVRAKMDLEIHGRISLNVREDNATPAPTHIVTIAAPVVMIKVAIKFVRVPAVIMATSVK